MPGNTTISKSRKVFLPVFWAKVGFTPGQTTGVAMPISGFPGTILEFVLPRETTLLTVGIMLSQALTAGFLRFELTRNGTPTGKTVDVDSAVGTRKLWTLRPGEVTGDVADEVGILWGSSPAMAPSGVVDGVIFLEVQEV
jgi:hypothetical protein